MPDVSPKRVKDEFGTEYTTRSPDPQHVEVLKKRAVDANGRNLPPKYKTSVAKKAAASKTPIPTSTTSGVEPADNPPEEGSS